jgi:hypothetical protein
MVTENIRNARIDISTYIGSFSIIANKRKGEPIAVEVLLAANT